MSGPLPLFSGIEQGLISWLGSIALVGTVIILVFVVLYVLNRINFRYAIMVVGCAIPSFVKSGWFPPWVEGLTWFIVVGFGLYYAYSIIKGY